MRKELRLIGLCPNPEFNALGFPGRVVICVQKTKKKSDHVHVITLPANPVYGAQVALLRCPILRYG